MPVIDVLTCSIVFAPAFCDGAPPKNVIVDPHITPPHIADVGMSEILPERFPEHFRPAVVLDKCLVARASPRRPGAGFKVRDINIFIFRGDEPAPA